MSQPQYPRRPRYTPGKRRRLLLILLLLLIVIVGLSLFAVYRMQHRIIKNELGLRNLPIDSSLLQTGIPFYTYENEDDRVRAVPGVDVSTFQGEIDWPAVKAAGAEFAIVRAAYRGYETGKLVPDDTFARNVERAAAAGLHVGVYLFSQALNEEEAVQEADYLLELIDGYPVDYPVVYDQEEYTADQARTDGLTGEQATKNALAFCRRIHEAGHLPMVYTNNDWAGTMYDMKQLDHYPIWFADYTTFPTLSVGFAMWQYTDQGTVPGISGPVDLNLLLLPDNA